MAAIAENDDLIWEILSRLPPKSVIRFKIACKQWMSLLSRPAFITDHTRRRGSNSPGISSDLVLLLQTKEEETIAAFSLHEDATSLLPDPSLSFIYRTLGPSPRYFIFRTSNEIWSSCNGLVLCVRSSWSCRRSPIHYSFWVANPTTMEIKVIPPLPPMTAVAGAGVVFDPSSQPHRYRVVCFGCRAPFNRSDPRPYEFATYDSETGAWGFDCNTTIDLQFYSKFRLRCVFWNGMLNWVICLDYGHGDGFLVSFDAERQLMDRTPLPVLPEGLYRQILSFHESGGRLLLIEAHTATRFPDGSQKMRFDIMEMDAERSGWSLLYRVDLAAAMIENLFPDVFAEEIRCFKRCPVLVLPGSNADNGDVLLLIVPGKIVTYCLKSKSFRVVRAVCPTKTDRLLMQGPEPWHVLTYTHTLFSP